MANKSVYMHTHAHAERERERERYAYEWICEGSVPEFGCVYQRLVSPKGQSRPSLTHLALEYINGAGMEARRLSYSEKPTFSLYLPLFTPFLVHTSPPPPLLVLSYYLLLLLPPPPPPPPPISLSVLRLHSPSSPEGSLFNRDKNSELHGP